MLYTLPVAYLKHFRLSLTGNDEDDRIDKEKPAANDIFHVLGII